jgi:type I restriction-modification system DNA methylase subunit
MFVQSEKFVESHGGRIGDIAIYGQESNYTTWRLCKMNLAVRGIDADIRWNNEGSFHKDELKDLRFDYILANPPFNISDWGASGYVRMRAGPMARRLSLTPTTHGLNIFSGTWHLTVRRV